MAVYVQERRRWGGGGGGGGDGGRNRDTFLLRDFPYNAVACIPSTSYGRRLLLEILLHDFYVVSILCCSNVFCHSVFVCVCVCVVGGGGGGAWVCFI